MPPGGPPQSPRPTAPDRTGAVRTLAWAPAAGASEYEVQLFRGSNRVYRARQTTTTLDLGPTWRYAGRAFRLVPGTYRWYVWVVTPTGARKSQPIVQARVQIDAD